MKAMQLNEIKETEKDEKDEKNYKNENEETFIDCNEFDNASYLDLKQNALYNNKNMNSN